MSRETELIILAIDYYLMARSGTPAADEMAKLKAELLKGE